MKKYYPSSSERKPNQSAILRIVSEEEALQLRPESGLSVAVVVIIPRFEKNTVETLLIKERNSYNPQVITAKFPSGSMEHQDKDIIAAVIRESRMETGYESRNIQFCFAAEYSSTIQGERHIKVFFLAKDHEKVGDPTEADILATEWKPFLEIGKISGFPKNQRVALPEIHKKIMGISTEMAYALMNNGTGPAPMEGTVE